jgi:fructokinase
MTSSKNPRVVVVGEILFDVIRGKKHLGGAPFNFAWHMLHLGFRVRFVSRVGSDETGREMIKRLKNLGFPVADIQTDLKHATGTVTVTIDSAGTPEFDIAAPVAYDYIEFMKKTHAPVLKTADWLYYGTLSQRRPCGHAQIQRFLRHMPESKTCFYDMNLRPDGYTREAVLKSLDRTTILKLNDAELDVCRQILAATAEGDALVRQLMQQFDISRMILTRGSGGSVLYTQNQRLESPPAPVKTMADSVGAGDAFAAMFSAGTLNGQAPEQALAAASEFASRICEISGAIPQSTDFYASFRNRLHGQHALHKDPS